MKEKYLSDKKIRSIRIASFIVFFVMILAAIYGWRKLRAAPKTAENGGTTSIERKALGFNEKFFTSIFNSNADAKTYDKAEAVPNARVNGSAGLSNGFDAAAWRLHVIKAADDTLLLSIDDIKKLPKTEVVFNFKCIEGWNQITWWGGVKFSDFIKAYGLQNVSNKKYLGLVTPDNGYYVGIDIQSAMHEQTILCYELNGKPLPLNQGAPLRLIIPLKYGVKHLKRIGNMFFSDEKPKDYWAERGYDYYTGH